MSVSSYLISPLDFVCLSMSRLHSSSPSRADVLQEKHARFFGSLHEAAGAQGSSAAPVLVTGACGHLGAQLVSRLTARGDQVIATDSEPAPEEPAKAWGSAHDARVEFWQADLTDPATVATLVDRCDAVIHTGRTKSRSSSATSSAPHGSPTENDGTNPTRSDVEEGPEELLRREVLEATVLFQAAVRAGCRRVVYSSSAHAYGGGVEGAALLPRANYLPFDERHPLFPCDHFGLGKAIAEMVAEMLVRLRSSGSDGDGLGEICGSGRGPGGGYGGTQATPAPTPGPAAIASSSPPNAGRSPEPAYPAGATSPTSPASKEAASEM